MSAEQKRAWFLIGILSATALAYAGLVPFMGVKGAMVAFGLMGLVVFMGFIGRKEVFDERTRAISNKASLIGFIASYETFIIACMGTWAFVYLWQGKESVSAHWLAVITVLGFGVGLLVYSIATLVLYGRRVEADNG